MRHLHVKTIRSVDDVINEGGLALVERLHGSAASVVLNPLQNQTHDVDAAQREKHSRVVKMLEQKLPETQEAAERSAGFTEASF